MTYVTDKIKIEVEIPQPTGLQNLVWNPNGELGAWGWIAAAAGNAISSNASASNNTPGTRLELTNNTTMLTTGYTNRFAIAAGQWTRGALTVVNSVSSTNYFRMYFIWVDANNVALGTSSITSYINMVNGNYSTNAVQAPANTVEAVFTIQAYSNNSGGNFPSGNTMYFNNVMVAKAATSGALSGGLTYQYPYTWQDVTSSVYDIDIEVAPLDTGTVNISLMDPALDPAISGVLKVGKRIRVMSLISGSWEPVFNGKIADAKTTYHKDKFAGSLTDRGAVRVNITATDGLGQLSNYPEPRGVETINELRGLMETKGVPWNIGQSRNQNFLDSTVVSQNANATMLDQIAITTDTQKAFAWIDRFNVVYVQTAADLSSLYGSSLVTFDDSAGATISYTDADVSWSTDELVNVITCKYQRYNSGSGAVEEVTYGPYSDQNSVEAYGAQSREYTVGGPASYDNDAYWRAWALGILAAQATPVTKVKSLTMKVTNATELQWATRLGLFSPVTIEFDTRVNAAYRITSIKHTITSEEWHVTYEFTLSSSLGKTTLRNNALHDGLGNANDSLGWLRPGDPGGPTWASGWADLNSTVYERVQMKKVGTTVRLVGVASRASGSSNTILTLPAGCRPNRITFRWGRITTGWAEYTINTNGTVDISMSTVGYTNGQAAIFDMTFDTNQS